MNEFQREIYKTIDILTGKKLKELGFDRTKRGKVVSVSYDTCIVQIDGEEYTCKISRGTNVQPNDIAYVKFPQNNDSDKYIETVLGGNETPENLVISAEDILAKLKTVDGVGSGLDADMLGGKHSSEYVTKDESANTYTDYVHSQISPSEIWIVSHNLSAFPSVSIIDSSGNLVYGDVKYVDDNNITVNFNAPFSGKAYFR